MIYDSTMFFIRNDLFDLRYEELKDVVDKIIVVESAITFSGAFKGQKFNFNKYKNNDKILYYYIDDINLLSKLLEENRGLEIYQRNFITNLISFKSDDILIISDLDEILHRDSIDKIIKLLSNEDFIGITLPMYYYYLNGFKGMWNAVCALKCNLLNEDSPNTFRWRSAGVSGYLPRPNHYILKGCHFSYLGSSEYISKKIKNLSERSLSIEKLYNIDYIKQRVENNLDLFDQNSKIILTPINESYPKVIFENWDYWKTFYKECET